MSRIGKQTIQIPQGVTVTVQGTDLQVQGPKGTLVRSIHPLVTVMVQDGVVTVDVEKKEEKYERSLWGTHAAHIKNMILGVTNGFKKELEVNGVGYKVAMQGTDIRLDVGFSHPVIFKIPQGMTASVEKNVITLVGADKEMLGAVAAEIRQIRKPEPYKGKGIKHMEEHILRKAGKAAKSAS